MSDLKQKLKIRLPVILLLAATLLFWGFYDRYEVVDLVLLDAPSLSAATRVRGDCAEANGHFVLTVPEGGKTASINFRMPDASGYDQIRVRGRIKVTDVVEGKFSWRCARVLLTQYDERNQWISGHHGVVAERGSKGWTFHEDVFEMDPRAVHVDLVIQQSGRSGTAEFDRLVVEPVRFRASFPVWRLVFFVLWVFMGGLYFRRCRLHARKFRILILLNALAILAGALMPSVWIQDSSERVKVALEKAFEKPVAPQEIPLSGLSDEKLKKKPSREMLRIDQFNEVVGGAHRVGHFLLFASLCFWVYLSAALERQHLSYYFKVAFDILLFAGVTEALQYLTLDRTAGIRDFETDAYGLLSGLMLFLVIRFVLSVGASKGRFGV